MRGNLPGNTINEGPGPAATETVTISNTELSCLFDRKHVCPVCDREFTVKTVKSGTVRSDGMDVDMYQRVVNIDVVKYRVIECPHCGYADMDTTFDRMMDRERKTLKGESLKWSLPDSPSDGEREYEEAFRMYRSAIRCDLIRGAKKGKRAYTALHAAWVLRGWRNMLTDMGTKVRSEDPMSEEEENKLLRYALKNYKEAELTEDFPISGMDEPTFDYLMGALSYETGNITDSGKYVLKALQNKSLKAVIRIMAEDLRDTLRKERESGHAQ